MIKKIVLGSVIACSVAFGNSMGEININDETLEVGLEYNLNGSYDLNNNSNYYFTASYLRSEDTAIKGSDSDTLMSAGLKVMNPYIDDYGFSLGLGIKGVVADNSTQNFVAAPLQVFVTYMINEQLHLDGEVGYAPKVLAFSDGETYMDWKAKVNYQVIDNGFVYLGVRDITTEYTNGTKLSFDDTMFFGFKVQF